MEPIDYISFAAKIKEKYPMYKDMDDLELAKKMIVKFPQYKATVTFDPVKKKDETDATPSIQGTTDTTLDSETQQSAQHGGISGSNASFNAPSIKDNLSSNNFSPNKPSLEKEVKTEAADFKPVEPSFDFEAVPEKEEPGLISEQEKKQQALFKDLVIAEEGSAEQQEIIRVKNENAQKEEFKKNNFLSSITDNIITGNEEDATDLLRKEYGKYGFTFEEKGMGDAMRVTSKYGEPLDIDLDVSEMLFGKVNEQSAALKDYLWKNKANDEAFDWEEVVSTMRKEPSAVSEKLYSKLSTRIDSKIGELVEVQNKLGSKIKSYESTAKENGSLSEAQYSEYKALLSEYNEGVPEIRKFTNIQKDINISAGLGLEQVVARNEKLGTTSGALGNKLLAGAEALVSASGTFVKTVEDSVDKAVSLAKYSEFGQELFGAPDIMEMSQTMYESEKRSDVRKDQIKLWRDNVKGFLTENVGSATSKEYTESEDRSVFMKAAMGVTESIPGMATGFAGMALQSFDAVAEEWTNNPEYESMPLSDLLVVGGSVAIIQGTLEKAGLTSMFSKSPAGKSLMNKILKNTLGKVTSKQTKESFNRLVAAETNSLLKNGTIKIVGGGIVEGETGALQEISDIGIKNIYNNLGGKEIFETPDTFGEAVSQVKEAAKMEALGGVIMKGAMSAPKIINDGIKSSEMKPELVDALHYMSESPELKKSMLKTLKVEVLSKRMTLDEAKTTLRDFEKMTEIMKGIPSELKDKASAFNLVIEKNKIEKEIEGKDPALVEAKKERVNEINEELKSLTSKGGEDVKAKSQVELHKENGGSSISQSGENLIGKPGFAVSTHTDKTVIVKGKDIDQEVLDKYKESNKEALENPNNFIGTWYDSKSDQTYIDISTRTESKQEAIALGIANNQKAIFDLESMNEIDTGGTGEVKQEPAPSKQESKIEEASNPSTTQVATSENLKARFKAEKNERKSKIIRAAHNVVSSLKSVQGVKVFVHETTDEYNSAIANTTGESKESIDAETQKSSGEYITDAKEVHINLENESTDSATVYHEAFHAVFEAKGITDGAAKEMADGLKRIVKDKDLVKRVEDFISSYESSEQGEEFMAEITGILADSAKTLDANGLHKLIALINKIATKIIGSPIFKATASRQEVLDFINKTSSNLSNGVEIDVAANGAIGVLSDLNRKARLEKVIVKDDHALSFVSKEDIIDIDHLISEIAANNQKVWFWTADQLGRGMYADDVIGEDHYLDAGPSYPLDPDNRSRNVIWASGMKEKAMNNKISESDYIFIISGSPEKSKLFNQEVSNLIKKRIEKNVNYKTFKSTILKAKPTKSIASMLKMYNSFDELLSGKDRKKFLLAINEQGSKKTQTAALLHDYDAILDPNELRDGFYADNDFQLGDIMIVLKPTGVGGKSKHSTYETDVLGSVVGVPDKKVNSFDIMTEEFRAKYSDEMTKTMKSQIVAPYGVGVRDVQSVRKKQLPKEVAEKLTEDNNGNYVFHNYGRVRKNTITPSPATGEGLQTGREERNAINSVGGMTQTYTMSNQGEIDTGDVKHTLLIPKSKVYHIQSDVDNFYDEAKKQFEKSRPGQAFNPNYQTAWITKVANDNGYEMTVTNWKMNELRGQTLLPMTPIEGQVEFKEIAEVEYKDGDNIVVYGENAVVTSVSGDIVSFKGDSSSGSINAKRSKKQIRKKRVFNKKRNEINTLVRAQKENGTSDKDIRLSLKDEWYTDKEVDSAIAEYNLIKEGIWTGEGRSKITQSILKFKKRAFSARKFLPKSAFKAKEDKEALVAVHLNRVDKNVKDFNRFYKKYDGDKKKLVDDFDAVLRGEEDIELPEGLVAIARSMRNQIDSLSQTLIDNGLVDEHMEESITNNIGQYLTRSYKVYDRENWAQEVEQEVLQKATNLLKKQYTSIAEKIAEEEGRDLDLVLNELVDGRIAEMLNKAGASKFVKGSKLGSKDNSILKEKTDIPFEIRSLMGEYSDPALNYSKTVLKLSALAANHKFLNETRENGVGVFLFEEPRGDYNVKISSDSSPTMNPLNGLYTTKEIAEEFESQPQDLGTMMEYYMKAISAVKWAKTIGSIATHSKNITGNLGFVWLNGHSKVSEMKGAYQTVRNDFSSGSNAERRVKMDHYISLGIVKQSAGLGEIMDMFKDADWDNAMATRLTAKDLSIAQKAKRFLLKSKKVLEDAYQAEDDFFKIVAYENELSRYSKAMFGKDKSKLSSEERGGVDEVVSEIVKNTYPTYSRVPDVIQKIRRFPLIGNFISFQAESYRTAVNTALMTTNELSSDNPAIRKIGARRLAGAATYLSTKTAILSYFSLAAGTGLTGFAGGLFNDDEEDQKSSDIRLFIAPWSKKSDLLILSAENGKVKYIDFSASDPHGAMHKVVNAALSGNNTLDGIKKGAIEVVEPFVGVEITTAAVNSLANNKDAYGKPIWNITDNLYEQSLDIIAFATKLIEPGTVTSVKRVFKSDDKSMEITAALSGFRVMDTNIEDQFGFKIKDISEDLPFAKADYSSAYRKYERGEMSAADLAVAYKKSNDKVKKIYDEIIVAYDSAERLGVDREVLAEKLKQFRISSYRVEEIQKGKVEDLREKDYKSPKKSKTQSSKRRKVY